MRKTLFFLFLAALLISLSYGQSAHRQIKPRAFLGPGAGLDYGGFGLKLEYLVIPNISLFGGAGYNVSGLGTNGGVSWKILPNKKSTPFLLAMYGYNAVIVVNSTYNRYAETYYGFSTGIGYDFGVGRKGNKVSVSVLVPFRNNYFKERYKAWKEAGYTFFPGDLPVLLSVGFNVAGYGRAGSKR